MLSSSLLVTTQGKPEFVFAKRSALSSIDTQIILSYVSYSFVEELMKILALSTIAKMVDQLQRS